MKTLYLFIDESGNLDFSSSGTKYYLLNVLSTTQPFNISSPLLKLRYELLPNYACGPQMEDDGYFHASEDIQTVRNQVFSILTTTDHDLRVDSVIAQKNKTNHMPEFRSLYISTIPNSIYAIKRWIISDGQFIGNGKSATPDLMIW